MLPIRVLTGGNKMQLLTQNTKMKKSSDGKYTVVNWTIPAFQSSTGLRTCPNAGLCATGCYARSGTYMFANVKRAHEAKLALTLTDTFIVDIVREITAWLDKKSTKLLKVRIHDAGDFYSAEYLAKWIRIMTYFEMNSRVSFYAYTKQVELFKQTSDMPHNFTVIFSYGGRQDRLIDVNADRHSRVFETVEALKAAGYVDGTTDDMVAATHPNPRIGLVFHHAKNWENTKWAKVSAA
jgi:hypothetical protein